MGEPPALSPAVPRFSLKVQRLFLYEPWEGGDLLPSEVGKELGESRGPGKQDVQETQKPGDRSVGRVWLVKSWREWAGWTERVVQERL